MTKDEFDRIKQRWEKDQQIDFVDLDSLFKLVESFLSSESQRSKPLE
jgi:hypothetical protein